MNGVCLQGELPLGSGRSIAHEQHRRACAAVVSCIRMGGYAVPRVVVQGWRLYLRVLLACACVLRFFEDYKKNENKHVRVDEILGAEEAVKAVKDGLVSAHGKRGTVEYWCSCDRCALKLRRWPCC